ncbi:MAG: diguanylate cyclase [Pseudomonadota bacterium]
MPSRNNQKIRVLIIDDSSTVRIAASRIMGDEFDVLLAVDGEDGLDVIESDPNIQVVFTDLVMPEMDGFELLEAIRTHHREYISGLPVIIMTGAENPEIAKQKAFSMGATDFVTKPFVATDIRARAQSYAKLNDTTKTLRQQTTIDSLTGLLNIQGFQKQLDKEIAFIQRHQYVISAMAIEVDHYKDMFISMGRNSTEAIISRIAKTLNENLRKEDSLARTGLAKFCVSMPLVSKENALEMANKICTTIEQLKVTLGGKRLLITASAGLTQLQPEDEFNASRTMLLLDSALHKAKKIGKSQFYILSPDDYRHAQALRETKLSIDKLLEQLQKGEDTVIADQLDAAIDHLAPLLALLSNEQRQRMLTYRH